MIVTIKNYYTRKWYIEGLSSQAIGTRMTKLRNIIIDELNDGYDFIALKKHDFIELIEKLYNLDEWKNKAKTDYPRGTEGEYYYDTRKAFYKFIQDENNAELLYIGFKEFVVRGFYKKGLRQMNIQEEYSFIGLYEKHNEEFNKFVEERKKYWERDQDREKFEKERIAKKDNDYKEYLNSPERKEKRKLVFEKDGERCVMCGTIEGPRDCHHRKYDKFKQEDEIEDLFLLCRCCHERHHKNPDKQSYYRMIRESITELSETPTISETIFI